MSVANWIIIGISAAMFILMLLSWLGVNPKILQKVLPKKGTGNINGFAIMAGLCVIVIVYLAIVGKDIPTSLSSITTILVLFYFYTR